MRDQVVKRTPEPCEYSLEDFVFTVDIWNNDDVEFSCTGKLFDTGDMCDMPKMRLWTEERNQEYNHEEDCFVVSAEHDVPAWVRTLQEWADEQVENAGDDNPPYLDYTWHAMLEDMKIRVSVTRTHDGKVQTLHTRPLWSQHVPS